jgi:hypothetical protein
MQDVGTIGDWPNPLLVRQPMNVEQFLPDSQLAIAVRVPTALPFQTAVICKAHFGQEPPQDYLVHDPRLSHRCDSQATPSGGGSAITNRGMARLLAAAQSLEEMLTSAM